VEQALEVVHWKTTRYSFMRPLQIGAMLADADQSIVDGYAEFATPLGEAYQLRDDILGVFGDPALTGKSNGDDLREARPTVLRALAEGRSVDPKVIVESGALDAAEQRIEQALAAALDVLETLDIAEEAKSALRHLAIFAARRNS
jgi:geranylgeranyl diphosphate synthase type I